MSHKFVPNSHSSSIIIFVKMNFTIYLDSLRTAKQFFKSSEVKKEPNHKLGLSGLFGLVAHVLFKNILKLTTKIENFVTLK